MYKCKRNKANIDVVQSLLCYKMKYNQIIQTVWGTWDSMNKHVCFFCNLSLYPNLIASFKSCQSIARSILNFTETKIDTP